MPIVWTFGLTLSSHKKYHYCRGLTTPARYYWLGGDLISQNEENNSPGEIWQMRRNNTLQCDPHTSHGFCTLYCAKFNYFLPDFLFTVKNVHKLHSYHFMRAERANNWQGERGSRHNLLRLTSCEKWEKYMTNKYQSDYHCHPCGWRGGHPDSQYRGVLGWWRVTAGLPLLYLCCCSMLWLVFSNRETPHNQPASQWQVHNFPFMAWLFFPNNLPTGVTQLVFSLFFKSKILSFLSVLCN